MDKAEDAEKANFIGKLFKAYTEQKIDVTDFLELSFIVSNLIVSNIKHLPSYTEDQTKKYYSRALHAMGLLIQTSGANNSGIWKSMDSGYQEKENSLSSYWNYKNNDAWKKLITWDELYPLLVPINIKIKNNLFVSVSACFGAYIFNSINITDRAPFYCFVGPSNTMPPDKLLTDFKNFFATLMRTPDINTALDDLNSSPDPNKYLAYTSELIFEQVYTNWLKMYQDGSYVEDKVKQLVSRVKADPENSGEIATI